MLPHRTMIKTNLTEDLIFLGCACLGESLAEEAALAGNILFNRTHTGKVSTDKGACGNKTARAFL